MNWTQGMGGSQDPLTFHFPLARQTSPAAAWVGSAYLGSWGFSLSESGTGMAEQGEGGSSERAHGG